MTKEHKDAKEEKEEKAVESKNDSAKNSSEKKEKKSEKKSEEKTSSKTSAHVNGFKEFFSAHKLDSQHLVIASVVIFLIVAFFGLRWESERMALEENMQTENVADQKLADLPEEIAVREERARLVASQLATDSSGWAIYQNRWYGFSLKYPKDWAKPVVTNAPKGSLWERKIHFGPATVADNASVTGFDVKLYDINTVGELFAVDEYPLIKHSEFTGDPACETIEGHLSELGNYPIEHVYVPATDKCFSSAFFFQNTRDNYIYVITPSLKDGHGVVGDPADMVTAEVPEIYAAVKTWALIDIVRPKPKPKAPKPVSYKKDDLGRLVCAKKNDKPGKSKKGKDHHLDMECCLDPDEDPNPWCYYDPAKYGKWL